MGHYHHSSHRENPNRTNTPTETIEVVEEDIVAVITVITIEVVVVVGREKNVVVYCHITITQSSSSHINTQSSLLIFFHT